MKSFVLVTVLCVFTFSLFAQSVYPPGYEQAKSYGAKTKVILKVVDNNGCPVNNARVEVYFNNWGKKEYARKGLTDENGLFPAKQKSIGEVYYFIKKEGYYNTQGKITFVTLFDREKTFYDNKWQPYGKTYEVILKPIKNPINTKYNWFEKDIVTNINLGFDFQFGDFVKPYGNGEVVDFNFRIETTVSNYWCFHSKMSVSFTNKFDGAYLLKKDQYSEYESVYHATTNNVYLNKLNFEYNSMDLKNIVKTMLSEDQYMIFRTRTKTNEKGELIEAFYTKVYNPFSFLYGKMIFKYFHNTNINDTNLEAIEELPFRHKKRP